MPDFFVLKGDHTRDRRENFNDLLILQQRFGVVLLTGGSSDPLELRDEWSAGDSDEGLI